MTPTDSAAQEELARLIAKAWATTHSFERTIEETLERREVLAGRFLCSGEAAAIAAAITKAGYVRQGWRPIYPTEDQWLWGWLYAPPENIYERPAGREGEIRFARPRDYTWATLIMPFDKPAPPVPPTEK